MPDPGPTPVRAPAPFAELHCHTNFSFLDGASAPDELVERAAALGLSGLAITDHQGLYGIVRFTSAAEALGIHPVIGLEVELVDAVVDDPHRLVLPARRRSWRGRAGMGPAGPADGPSERIGAGEVSGPAVEGLPTRLRPVRARLPGHRPVVKEDLRGVGAMVRGPHLVLLARDETGYRSLCRLVSRANMAGTKGVPRFSQALLAEHADGLVALSGCRDGEIARRLRAGDRDGARLAAERYGRLFGGAQAGLEAAAARSAVASAGFVLELGHHLLPDDDWLVAETAALADELGLPVVVTNDVHYALPDDRELHDIVTAIRHGRTLETLADLRTPSGEHYLKSAAQLAALPPGDLGGGTDARTARAWAEGLRTAGELAAACSVELSFERYRFPGFPVPPGETPFSHLQQLCQEGARRRYHPISPAVFRQLAHELDVIERTGLAEFFLICWDLMRHAREKGIPAQGRGSAADSIVAYVLGITRVDPIRHNLLFERFINEGRTAYPDVDIDFSSERREEIIQYVYGRYGPEHTGMVCNLVTYRARSAVREVGLALGFPRPLVDRVAKALETYDSVMVRRDLEAEGGFGQFFRRPAEEPPETAAAARSGERGLTDRMGQLAAGGRGSASGGGSAGSGSAGSGSAGSGSVVPGSAVPGSASGGGSAGPGSAGPGSHRLPPAMVVTTETRAVPHRIPPGVVRRARDGTSPVVSTTVDGVWHDPPHGEQRIGPGRSGMWEEAPASPPAIRAGGDGDDEGGPGDTPASVAWLRAGRGTGYRTDDGQPTPQAGSLLPRTVDGRRIDPESGVLEPPGRRTDRLGRPNHWDPPAPRAATMGRGGDRGGDQRGDQGAGGGGEGTHSSVARVEPQPAPRPRGGSTRDLSDWERWLEFCARIDGFPRHLSIHSGGMLVTAAPLIDIAPLERATMADRVVVQFDKRDVETLKLIKLDLLGLGMLAAIDETLQLIEHDCATCVDLDRLPEDIPEVFEMLQAADTVGVFQVESRAQMQTLPKSRPRNLDDLVVEVAIIRPGPIQGNAVHPYLRRKQGLEPVTYLHPTLEPILADSMGVILYQEQVMRIAIDVAGFSPADSDGFRRAMGTWRSSKEMEKLHRRFVDGCLRQPGMDEPMAEELFRQVAAFASFGFAKSHAAAFARTAYESSFLKLFYPAQFVVGLINAQPMGFYPVEVLVNDAKRHGVAVLPVDINASGFRTTTEWVGRPGWAMPGSAASPGSAGPGEPLPPGVGIDRRPDPVVSPACVMPSAAARGRWAAESAPGWGVRLGLGLVKGVGKEQAERLDAELARGPYRDLADVVERTGLAEEVIERLIRVGALDSLGRPRRELLWQLREVAGATKGRAASRVARRAAGRPADLRLPATEAPPLPGMSETERLGDSYAVIGLDARRQVVGLFRPALERLGAVTNAALAERRPGRVRIGGLVVTRQHPMTARGTVFLALEDETGMANVTLWPDTWARLRTVVRRHALLLVDGELQREGNVVNIVAHAARPLPQAAAAAGGPEPPTGVRQLGNAGMRRLG
ncbi:MAG: PHP domain-containing protein [Candidatus Limnocylindrales bacterium]